MSKGRDGDPALDATMLPASAAPPATSGAADSALDATVLPAMAAGTEATIASHAVAVAVGTGVPGAARTGTELLPAVDRGQYEIVAEYARGGLGRIMKARDRRTGRMVAIKEMLPERPSDAARFAREALVTANLQHPAIVPVYEVGRWPTGEPFYAMKLVAGRSLDEVVGDARSLDARLALLPRLIVVADALAYAHGQGVMHRDLKPANVLAGDFGETVLIDWGLARRIGDPDDGVADGDVAAAAGAAEGATVVGAVVGTPAYMPPEQALGEPLDDRADVYSLGAILYHVLVGHAPYGDLQVRGVHDLLARVIAGPPTALARLVPGAPADLVAIVDKAMARRREDRYASAAQLAEELGRFQTGQLVGAHRYSGRERLARWVRRNRAAVSVAALALVVIAVGATFAISNVLRERDRARAGLAEALMQKGREAEGLYQWDRAAAYFAAARAQDDRDDARWAAGLAGARPLPPRLHLATGGGAQHAVAISPDGAMIAAGGHDGVVRRWRADGTPLSPVAGTVSVHALAFSPDGARLAIGDDHGTIRELDVAGDAVLRTLSGHRGRVWSLVYTSDGRLISGGEDGMAKVWTGDAVVTLAGHTQRVYGVSVSPDGQRVATASDDRTARVWSIDGGEGKVIRSKTANGIKTVDFVDDGHVVIGGWDERINHLDVTTLDEVWSWEQPNVINAVAVTPDRRAVIAAGDDRFVVVWDLATYRPVARLDGGGVPVLALALSADGNTLLIAGKDGIVRGWDTAAAGRVLRSLGHRSEVTTIVFAPAGDRLYSQSIDGTVRAWDLARGLELWRWADPGACDHGLDVLDGAVAAGCTKSGAVVVLEAETGALRRMTQPQPGANVTALAAHQGVIATGGGGDHAIRILDAATGEVTDTLPGHGHQIYGAAFSGDGQTLVTGSLDQTARRWRRDGGRWVAAGVDEGQDDDILRADISRDGRVIASCGETPKVRLWYPDEPARSTWLSGHTARIWTAELKSDASQVVSASDDGTVRLWDVASGRELRQWHPLPGAAAYAAAWSPDETRIAAGFADGTIVVYDVATGAIVRAFGHDASALSGGGCAGRTSAGLDPDTLAVVDRACRLDPGAHLRHVLSAAWLRLDGVDLVASPR